jgi:hypothetical protein
MPCLVAIIALVAPRFLIVVLWLMTNFFGGIFMTPLWPILGFVFLPTTLIWYTGVQHWFGGEWNGVLQIVGVVLALMIDVSPSRGRRRRRN